MVLVVSATYAITIQTLPTSKHGLWDQKVEDTKLQVTSFTHKILKDKVKSSIEIYNPTDATINAEVTVYYEPNLKTKTFNVSIALLGTFKDNWNTNLNITLLENIEVVINEW